MQWTVQATTAAAQPPAAASSSSQHVLSKHEHAWLNSNHPATSPDTAIGHIMGNIMLQAGCSKTPTPAALPGLQQWQQHQWWQQQQQQQKSHLHIL
jgi:hypothetical protein